MKTINLLLFASLLFGAFSINAQEDTISWSSLPENEQKADSLIEMSWQNILAGNWVKAKEYVKKGKKLSDSLNYEKGIADSFVRLGLIAQYFERNFVEAERKYYEALHIRKTLGFIVDAARVCNNLIGLFSTKGEFDRAIEIGEEGLKTLQTYSTPDASFFEVKAKLHNLLGAAYRRQNKFEEAIQNLEESLTIRKRYGPKKDLAKTFLNLGNLYSEVDIGNYSKAEEGIFTRV